MHIQITNSMFKGNANEYMYTSMLRYSGVYRAVKIGLNFRYLTNLTILRNYL